jgi:hypothetical protein
MHNISGTSLEKGSNRILCIIVNLRQIRKTYVGGTYMFYRNVVAVICNLGLQYPAFLLVGNLALYLEDSRFKYSWLS